MKENWFVTLTHAGFEKKHGRIKSVGEFGRLEVVWFEDLEATDWKDRPSDSSHVYMVTPGIK